jgi:hypothetical protein
VYFVRRRFLAGLALAVIATVVVLVVPRGPHYPSIAQLNAQYRAAERVERVDLGRLRVPLSFTSIHQGALARYCAGRCYLVRESPEGVAAEVGAIFRTIGITNAASREVCFPRSGPALQCMFQVPVEADNPVVSIYVEIWQVYNCRSAKVALVPDRGCSAIPNNSLITFS